MTRLRRWIGIILVFGLVGTGAELLLIGHYEDTWQWVPLVLIAVALAVLAWHAGRPTRVATRALQTTMSAVVLAGFLGVGLHFRGAASFQLDIDRSISWPVLVSKALGAKAPPVLAPGVMLQLGLLGLAYANRYHDRRADQPDPRAERET